MNNSIMRQDNYEILQLEYHEKLLNSLKSAENSNNNSN